MRLLLAAVLVMSCVSVANAFDSLDIPKEATRIDAMHPIPELREYSLVEEKDMACMQEMAIAQCTRKVYSNTNQRLMVVSMGGAPAYYWFYDPASKKISSVPFEGTKEDGFLSKDSSPRTPENPNAGDFFSNSNKQGGGNMNLFKF
ncbi:hypothetical protein JCM14635_19140 [Megalodesulfovibrio paquesii]